MSDVTSRKRQPAGISTGGQFATEPRTETTVALAARPAGLRLNAQGHVDGTDLPPAARAWAIGVEALIRTRRRMHAALGGTQEHIDEMIREAVQVRALAVQRDPSLANEDSLVAEPLSDAAGKLLRSASDEIADLPLPQPMTSEERSAAARMFARAAVVESRSRFGSPSGPSACLDAVAEFGAGDADHLVDEIASDLHERARQRRDAGEVLTDDEAIDIVNAWRAKGGLEALR